MRVERIESAEEFSRRAGPLLAEDEVRNTVMLGVLSSLRSEPDRYPVHHLWLVTDEGAPAAAALMTPPFHLLLARPRREDALRTLADHLRGEGLPIPGVNGALPEAEQFARIWTAGGLRDRVHMHLRLHELGELQPVPTTSGSAADGTPDDRGMLTSWWIDFARETGLQAEADEQRAGAIVSARLAAPLGLLVWEDAGRAVAMAGAQWSSPGIARVGPVYTPPADRRAGYATALVAHLTERLLAAGARRCLLYTDLANPTSNGIYARIGYRPVLDAVQIDFEPAGGISPSEAAPR